jgi:hypothetical protein
MNEENTSKPGEQKADVFDKKSAPSLPPAQKESSKDRRFLIARSLKDWIDTLVLPAPLSLAAIVLAAFLVFPAYRGLLSVGIIAQLEGQIKELQQGLDAEKARSLTLNEELVQRDTQLRQRQRPNSSSSDLGLVLSPLLSLEPKRSKVPDLIRISFAQSDRALLVFSLPKQVLKEIEMNIFQEQRLVWNQILPVSSEDLSNQNLVTFVISNSALLPGKYQLRVDGNPSKKRIPLAHFDLSVR